MHHARFIDIPPLQRVSGTLRLPGSKSISNRVLLLAGLSEGTTSIEGLLDSDDTVVMRDALGALGCVVETRGDVTRVTGIAGSLPVAQADLFLGNAGTAMRPLAAAIALLAARQGGRFTMRGVARMHERPIGDLVDALVARGCVIDYEGQAGYPPLCIGGRVSNLDLDAPIKVRGDVSSQFLSALLLALPLVAADRAVTIEVDGELISKPYVDLTLKLLERFGVSIRREGWSRFTIAAGSAYRSPGSIRVEGDASSASYFIAAGALAAVDAPLRIEGVRLDSMQGDIRFVEAARAMGAIVEGGDGWLDVRRGAFPLRSITLDCTDIPDAAMTLAVLALFAIGTTLLTHIASWRVKETDRLAAMATELRKLGASVVEGADFIEITPPSRSTWKAAAIDTYDDHRIAMCFSLAAFNALLLEDHAVPVRILDPRCVGKTFPDYFETLFSVAQTSLTFIPVLAIDGPTASGKGTLASAVADALGYRLLDSGAVYRATALAAMQRGVQTSEEETLVEIAGSIDLRFANSQAFLNGANVTDSLRAEDVGLYASRIAALPRVRQALLDLQLSFHRPPGLVADGRDMGTVVFPGAALKVYLSATAAERAARRHRQLLSTGLSANIAALRADLEARDLRDTTRAVAPLKPAADALMLDNSNLSIDQSVKIVLDAWQVLRPFE